MQNNTGNGHNKFISLAVPGDFEEILKKTLSTIAPDVALGLKQQWRGAKRKQNFIKSLKVELAEIPFDVALAVKCELYDKQHHQPTGSATEWAQVSLLNIKPVLENLLEVAVNRCRDKFDELNEAETIEAFAFGGAVKIIQTNHVCTLAVAFRPWARLAKKTEEKDAV